MALDCQPMRLRATAMPSATPTARLLPNATDAATATTNASIVDVPAALIVTLATGLASVPIVLSLTYALAVDRTTFVDPAAPPDSATDGTPIEIDAATATATERTLIEASCVTATVTSVPPVTTEQPQAMYADVVFWIVLCASDSPIDSASARPPDSTALTDTACASATIVELSAAVTLIAPAAVQMLAV